MLVRPPCSTLFPYTTLFRSSLRARALRTTCPRYGPLYLARPDQLCHQSTVKASFRSMRSKLVGPRQVRSEEHTSELQSRRDLVCRLLLEKKKQEVTAHTEAL